MNIIKKLRVCASCEYIHLPNRPCPRCEFGASYRAYWVYDSSIIKTALLWITQRPHKRRTTLPSKTFVEILKGINIKVKNGEVE